MWNTKLLAELKALKEKIAAERTERLIRFRGKCALSMGVVLGAAFPAVGGWSFEIPQPPTPLAWRSDVTPTTPYQLQVELTDCGGTGTDLALGLNIRGDAREDIGAILPVRVLILSYLFSLRRHPKAGSPSVDQLMPEPSRRP